jgi:transcriptional regulator with XRE-family HTH domain
MARPPGEPASTELRKTFGANFRAAREKAGMTQARVAEAIGTNRAYISHVERGVHNITIETMVQLAGVVGRRVADLLKPPRKKRSTP